MKRLLALLVVLAATSAPAFAQETSDAFLEQRVSEELAADGILLSRLGVTLDVEAVGDKLLVSLVDISTGRTVASTKLDVVPTDREAAVASLTQVVATLAQQLQAPVEAAPPAEEDQSEVRALAAAEHEYRESAIGFGDEIALSGSGDSPSRKWRAHRGEMKYPLDGAAFYQEIDRPDLAKEYRKRRSLKYAFGVGGLVATGGAVAIVLSTPDESCDLAGDFKGCMDRNERAMITHLKWGALVLGVGVLSISIAAYYESYQQPISEGEAKHLAAEHNQKLREKLGLPVDVDVSPYVTAQGGGLSVAGKF